MLNSPCFFQLILDFSCINQMPNQVFKILVFFFGHLDREINMNLAKLKSKCHMSYLYYFYKNLLLFSLAPFTSTA